MRVGGLVSRQQFGNRPYLLLRDRRGFWGVPLPVLLRLRDLFPAEAGHASLPLQLFSQRFVLLRPLAVLPARGKIFYVGAVVNPLHLSVDPAKAERLLQRLRRRDRPRAARLAEEQPDAAVRPAVVLKPPAELLPAGKLQSFVHGASPFIRCSRGFRVRRRG